MSRNKTEGIYVGRTQGKNVRALEKYLSNMNDKLPCSAEAYTLFSAKVFIYKHFYTVWEDDPT